MDMQRYKMATKTAKPNIQIDDLVREMTDEEYADYQASQAEAVAREAEATARIDARTSALAKLSALGLTQAEIESL
jgi:hypothetical protein